MKLPGQTDPLIENILKQFQPRIGKDLTRYRNHVYRVYHACLLMDESAGNKEKYAVAAAFHDIGIWTAHTFDYLKPSIEQASEYLENCNRQEWVGEISLMIYWHHKISRYSGDLEKTVEVFRRADWIDVSLGLLTFGLDKKKIKEKKKEYRNHGFHVFLIKQTLLNFLKHPFNPIPVFKK